MDIFDEKMISPMLIAKNRPAFDSSDYIYELKLDGIRCIAYLDKDSTVLRNKRNKHLNPIYPELTTIHRQVKERCILDGELAVFKNGQPDFFETQRRSLMTNPTKIGIASKMLPASFTAFDILYIGNERITGRALIERKNILRSIVTDNPAFAVSQYIEEHGITFYDLTAKQGLEGIVAKRKTGKYHIGKRTNDWIKMKALLDEDFVVCGYYFKEKNNVASIILGAYEGNKLVYQSHVSLGISRHDFRVISSVKRVEKQNYKGFPEYKDVIWILPKIVCAVQFMERTPGGGLRQPVFKGVKEDKEPIECVVNVDAWRE